MSKLQRSIQSMLSIDRTAREMEYEKHWWTWGDIAQAVDALDLALTDAGHTKDSRVGVLLRNRPECVPTIICLIQTGRCIVTLNADAPDEKLAEDIHATVVPVVIGLAEDMQRPAVDKVLKGTATNAITVFDGFTSPLSVVVADPVTASSTRRPVAPGIAIEMLSSGTTGKPKRIPLKVTTFERALLGAAAFEKGRNAEDPPRLRNGVQIVSAPFAHIAGITGLMNSIMAGRKFCLLEKFTVDTFHDALVRHRPKVAGAPPSALRMLFDAKIPREDLSSLVAFRSGTAPLDPNLVDEFLKVYGLPILQNYGATEFAGGVAGWTLDDFNQYWKQKWGAVGRVNESIEARAVDPQKHSVLATGEEGLLELRAPHINDGEWVRTTDLAVVDDDRFLWIRGRFDNAIIRGGFKVMPDDIVRALEKHEAIREASVTGIPDSRLGQVPVAAYILKKDAIPPDEADLKAFLKASLLPYQVPVVIKPFEDLPRTPSMKVSLPRLRELFTSADQATGESIG
jgi:long-chain acyl-CoA synthetase